VFSDLSPLLIPIIGVCIPIVAIVGGLIYKWNLEAARHETIRRLVEKGQPIPPELLPRGQRGDAPLARDVRSPLRHGIKLVAVGVGLALMFLVMQPGSWLWSIGMVPLCLGLAYLLIWKLEAGRAQ